MKNKADSFAPSTKWFNSLSQVCSREDHLFLENLPIKIKRIVNFGCKSGSEPFALLWTLNASEVMVIEIEKENIDALQQELDIVGHRHPESLQGRKVDFLCLDMSQNIPALPSHYFDLAYCRNTLYFMQKQYNTLNNAVRQMARVIKPGGFIVAVEPYFGVELDEQKGELSEPEDINYLFISTGLTKVDISGFPPFSYCYQKI